MALNPDDFDLLDCYFEGGAIVADQGVSWFSFSPKAVTLDVTKSYEITVTFEVTTGVPSEQDIYAYTMLPGFGGYWYTVYDDDHWTENATSYTFTVSGAHHDFYEGVKAGETRLLIQAYQAQRITGFTVFEAPYVAPFSPAYKLDETPTYPYENGENFNNYYSTGVRVAPGVLFSAWCHQGEHVLPDDGGDRVYEGRAVRYVDNGSAKTPGLALGPRALGPKPVDLPGFPPEYLAAYTNDPYGNYRIGWVVRCNESGLAFVQNDMTDWSQPQVGYLVQVDLSTLEANYVGHVDIPDRPNGAVWYVDSWTWQPAYGEGRVLIQNPVSMRQGSPLPPGDLLLTSLGSDGAVLAQRWLTTPAQPVGTFAWGRVAATVDCGTYFVTCTIDGNNPVQFWRHNVANNLPADSPTLICQQPIPVGGQYQYAFDFDATYVEHMGNGIIYIFESNFNVVWPWQARMWVLDVNAGTITHKATVAGAVRGFSGHLMDYMTIEKIDDTRALYSIQEYSNEGGMRVGIFDGEIATPVSLVWPWEASRSPYTTRNIWSVNSAEGFYVGDGHCVVIANGSEDDLPYPGTSEDPVQGDQTWAIAARLFTMPKLEGQLRSSRRHFRRNH